MVHVFRDNQCFYRIDNDMEILYVGMVFDDVLTKVTS